MKQDAPSIAVAAADTLSAGASARVEPLPEAIHARLAREGFAPESLCLWAEGDLDPAGAPSSVWVVASESRLVAVPADPQEHLPPAFDIKRVGKFQVRSTIGSAFLQAKVEGVFVDVARFSNGRRERFSKLVEQLERLREGQPPSIERVYEPSDRMCPKCGLPLAAPRAVCPRCIRQGAVLVRTFKLLRKYLGWVATLFSLMVVGIGLDMVPPYLTKELVDGVLKKEHGVAVDLVARERWLLWVVTGLVAASVARNLLNMVIGRLSTRVGSAITFDVRCRVFERLQQFSIDYYDRHPVGNLLTRVHGDAGVFHGFVNQVSGGFLLNILRIVFIGAMLFYLNVWLAMWVLIPIPFVILGTTIYLKRIHPRYSKLSDSNSKVVSLLNGIFSGVRLVKAYAQEGRERQRFTRGINRLRETQVWVADSANTFSPIMTFIFSLGGFIVWYAGGRLVLEDRGVTLGTLMAFFGYLGQFYGPLQTLTTLSDWLTEFLSSSQRVFDILDTPAEPNDAPDSQPMPAVRGQIGFDAVTFGYDPYNAVIKDISLSIEPGQLIGIVGKSGSGKTTLINLLCRFYDVQKGAIRIDGVDVRQMRRDDLRKHIGLVLQEPFLFRASIADNIAYGRPDAAPHEIMDAARAANAHDFIMRQPAGYDTQLGERGAGLSGGEKQRISIARALLCDPSILILDEATSNVDTESEQEIQKALAVLRKGRTTIAIAHRLSTLRGADRIYVIDQGRVAETGDHEELMAKKGIYHKLVMIQTRLTKLEQ
ncbi:MAG: ABC transporter ATP-binding protein [Verrucomicrobia bacterium]|nr:ABC transporter ATP-binding protein [Verrucomicrobiota bacterium]